MTAKPYVSNKPEDRLSIAVDRFLRRSLVPPFYCTAIQDSDHGSRTMLQRVRDHNRGVQKGILDWDINQWPGLNCKLELKRGKNQLTEAQEATVAQLNACLLKPVVAWTLQEVYEGLSVMGFRFVPQVDTVLQHCQAQLEAWDREAALVLAGAK